jgi:phage terminase large subunit-like protein
VPASGYRPRVAPPLPRRSAIADFRQAATLCERSLYAWQDLAGRYITATSGKRWLYREVCIIVGRQNGKSTILLPRIVMGLLRGERIMHSAQDRNLPREVFEHVADVASTALRHDLRKVRMANGQEAVVMKNGGTYRIVAPTRSGARGAANDLVILDEVQSAEDFDFVTAASPTLTMSKSPQMVYLGSGSTEAAVVMDALQKRAGVDTNLCYLEWSADPGADIGDRTAWRQGNPALAEAGETSDILWAALEADFVRLMGEGRPEAFETERLCRRVASELPRLVSEVAWQRGRQAIGDPVRPVLGIAADPAGRRASAVLAWKAGEDVECHVLADVTGYPVDFDRFHESIAPHVRKMGVKQVVFDPWTDRDLARYFKDPKAIGAAEYEAACERFARTVESGQLRYSDEDGKLSADVARTVRRDTAHGWIAVRAGEEAATASFAAIRAVWLATQPAPAGPRAY